MRVRTCTVLSSPLLQPVLLLQLQLVQGPLHCLVPSSCRQANPAARRQLCSRTGRLSGESRLVGSSAWWKALQTPGLGMD